MADGIDDATLQPDYNDVISTINNVIDEAAALRPTKEALNAVAVNAADEAVASTAARGSAVADVQLQADVGRLEAQRATQAIFEAAGGTERLVDLTEQKRKITDEIIKDETKLAKNTQDINLSSFFSNPQGTMKKLFEADAAKQGLARKQRLSATLGTAITGIASRTTAVARAEQATAEVMTNASVLSANAALKAEADIATNEAELKAASTNAAAVADAMRFSDTQVKNRLRLIESQVRQEQLGVTRETTKKNLEILEFRIKQFELGEEQRQVTLDSGKLGLAEAQLAASRREQERATTVQAIRVAQATFGQEPMTEQEIITLLSTGTKAEKEKLKELMAIGIENDGKLGSSPADVYLNLTKHSPDALVEENAAQQGVNAAVNSVAQRYETQGAPKGANAEAQIKSDIDEAIKITFDGYERSIKSGDTTNPNQAPPKSVMVTTKAVKDTALFTKVLKDIEVTEITPEDLTDLTVVALGKKQLTLQQAVNGLTTYYSTAANLNNAEQRREQKQLPPQLNYNTPLPSLEFGPLRTGLQLTGVVGLGVAGLLPSGEVVDMTDDTAIRNYVIRSLSAKGFGSSLIDQAEK